VRETVDVTAVKPVKEKALVKLIEKSSLSRRGFEIVRMGYRANDDWELGIVEALGEGDFEPVEVGDKVIVRAPSGGVAGADVSPDLGERKGSHIIVRIDEIVAKVE
jgi:co-chaperonin GroES (HSP10)